LAYAHDMGASQLPNRSVNAASAAAREIPYIKWLFVFFLLSLPLVNPTIHGDGVGYYAYARALLIQHNLRFEEDWRHANRKFSFERVPGEEQLRPDQFTATGYVDNRFTVGPAMLWSPFLIVAHILVMAWDWFGGHVPADGFSEPYLLAMAIGTAVCGFLGLLLSFSLAKKYVQDRWAFLATVGIWLASSLPVYMYFNPSWSHAQSAFAVALFLWYWDRTRDKRAPLQWLALGAIAGLMIDVYLPNGVFLLVPMIESVLSHWARWKERDAVLQKRLFLGEAVFLFSIWVTLLPTFITRKVIFGGFFRMGAYTSLPWNWTAPHWRQVLFSSDHGAFSWTPILALAIIGLFLTSRTTRITAMYLAAGAAAFYYVISSYPFWDGMASFGNRFLISLTPIFTFGLAMFFERSNKYFRDNGRAFVAAAGLMTVLAAWNAGFIFQWGEHLVPVRGEISFRQMTHNQFFVVPRDVAGHLQAYLFKRNEEMRKIDQRDIEEMRKEQLNSTAP
jgi:hypothetical protein